MTRLVLGLNVPPIASAPEGRGIRLAESGEECARVKVVDDGVVVRLVRDGYTVIVQDAEIVDPPREVTAPPRRRPR